MIFFIFMPVYFLDVTDIICDIMSMIIFTERKMIAKSRIFPWRKNEFVCTADLYQAIFEKTKNLNQLEAVEQISELTKNANVAKIISNAAIEKMMGIIK